ncbi:MAG: hypothetical protein WDZ40_01490 [Candidatus Spechtbacterales bacterium]
MDLNNLLKNKKEIILAVLVVAVLIGGALWFGDYSPENKNLSDNDQVQLTEEERLEAEALETIGKGKQSYSVSSTTEPRFTRFEIDPLDALKGDMQIAEVKLEHHSPVDSVTAELLTFSGTTSVNFELVEEVEENGVYKSTWRGEWTAEGLLGGMNITAVSGEDVSRVEPRFVTN